MPDSHANDSIHHRRSLEPELQRMLLRALMDAWHTINNNHFRAQLTAPVIALVDHQSWWGRWIPDTRHLEINRELIMTGEWHHVLETLKHEFAHQYVSEVAQIDEAPHGPVFRQTCARLGISARASCHFDPSSTPRNTLELDDDAQRLISRVKRLLALAESPNQNEAETAATLAQSLMLKYNLQHLQSDGEDDAESRANRYDVLHLGIPTGRVQEYQRRVAGILTRHFFVEGIWVPVYRPFEGKYGSVFEVAGTPANLSMAQYVHAFLCDTAARLWKIHQKTQQIRSNRDRLTFMAGVMGGFDRKLSSQRKTLGEQGLVWVPQASLDRYLRQRHPYIRTVSYGERTRNGAFAAGHQAGREIILHQPVEGRSTPRQNPRALGPAKRSS